MARVVLARRVRSQILALDWPLIDAVEEALALLERDPRAGYPLRGRLRGLNSLRVGSYRIIYQLAEDERTVRVAAVRHRSVAYKSDPRETQALIDDRLPSGTVATLAHPHVSDAGA